MEIEKYKFIMIDQGKLTTNRDRVTRLDVQRSLEIKRDGIVVYVQKIETYSYICLAFKEDDYYKLYGLIYQYKFTLQLCLQNGHSILPIPLDSICLLESSRLTVKAAIDPTRIYIHYPYYLIKRNPSISTHKSILMKSSSNSIRDYIEGAKEDIQSPEELIFQNQIDLNQSQNAAIQKVGKYALTFIKGPPGCGKTHTIARLSKLLYNRKKKILVGTVSNTGNLSILNQLIKQMVSHQERIWIEKLVNAMSYYSHGTQQTIINTQGYFAPNLVLYTNRQTIEEYRQLQPIHRYYSSTNWIIRNIIILNQDHDLSVSQIQYGLDIINKRKSQYSGIHRKLFSLYKQALIKTMSQADILISTTVSFAKNRDKFGGADIFRPNVAILDEASQATWADTYCFLQSDVQRMVLVGDDKQLDPTVISQDKLLKESVFSKLSQKKPEYFVLLDTQYRMHPEISEFPNAYFYESRLKDGVSAEERQNNIYYFAYHPVSFINHNVLESFYEDSENGKKNYYNQGEIMYIQSFLSLFPREQLKNVGIISPYCQQVQKLIEYFIHYVVDYGLTIKSCDGYQGGQKDFIIFSCVRSNPQGKIGFCGQKSRINVSLTRAKKALLIIGNKFTLSSSTELQESQNIWRSLITFLQNKTKVFQAEYINHQINNYITAYYHHLALTNETNIEANPIVPKQLEQFHISEEKVEKHHGSSEQPTWNTNCKQQIQQDVLRKYVDSEDVFAKGGCFLLQCQRQNHRSREKKIFRTLSVKTVKRKYSDEPPKKKIAVSIEAQVKEFKRLGQLIEQQCQENEENALMKKNKSAVLSLKKYIKLKAINPFETFEGESLLQNLSKFIMDGSIQSQEMMKKISTKLHQQVVQIVCRNNFKSYRAEILKYIGQIKLMQYFMNRVYQREVNGKLLRMGLKICLINLFF